MMVYSLGQPITVTSFPSSRLGTPAFKAPLYGVSTPPTNSRIVVGREAVEEPVTRSKNRHSVAATFRPTPILPSPLSHARRSAGNRGPGSGRLGVRGRSRAGA